MNTPTPVLNHELSHSVSEAAQQTPWQSRNNSQHEPLLTEPQQTVSREPVADRSIAHLAASQHAVSKTESDTPVSNSKTSSMHEQLLAWQGNAYRNAIAPLAALRARTATSTPRLQAEVQLLLHAELRSASYIYPHMTSLSQDSTTLWSQTGKLPSMLGHLVSNKGATVAASVAGAAAGGAIAGPFGVAAGELTRLQSFVQHYQHSFLGCATRNKKSISVSKLPRFRTQWSHQRQLRELALLAGTFAVFCATCMPARSMAKIVHACMQVQRRGLV